MDINRKLDPRTRISISSTLTGLAEFERILNSRNIDLLFQIINQEFQSLNESNTFLENLGIAGQDLIKTLMNLQCLEYNSISTEISLKSNLAKLSGNLKSDTKYLEEILIFLLNHESNSSIVLLLIQLIKAIYMTLVHFLKLIIAKNSFTFQSK